MKTWKLIALALLIPLVEGCVSVPVERFPASLDLGASADAETCRAVRRDDIEIAEGEGAQYELFCGKWRRAAAIVRVQPVEAAGLERSLLQGCIPENEFGSEQGTLMRCPGAQSSDLFQDVAIEMGGAENNVRARGLPGALPAMQRAGAVLTGAEPPQALSEEELALLPGVQAMQDQELLRRRGHQRNISYEFALAAADYAQAVAIQDGLFGGDAARRADIALDLALNLSNQGRFAEAERLLDDTSSSLGSQTTAWIQDKIVNYRAVHYLNKGDYAAALAETRRDFAIDLADGAAVLTHGGTNDLSVITAREAGYVNQRDSKSAPPLYSNTELRPEVRAIVLKAHRAYVQAVALSFLKRPEAADSLDEASALILSAPAGSVLWLETLVEEKRALDDLDAGRAGAAIDRLQMVLAKWRKQEPRSLLTARFLTSLGRARMATGDETGALADYHEAFELYLGVEGSFGVSPDNAGEYLVLLVEAINRNEGTAAQLKERYIQAFEAVVEPRAAAAMALASARIGSDTASVEIRALQDAERKLGDALQALQAEAGVDDPERLAALEAEAKAAEAAVLDAEAKARRAEPEYMQLVNRGVATEDIETTLAPNEALIAFTATRSGGLGYAIFGGETRVFKTGLTRETAEALVRRLRVTLRSRAAGVPPYGIEQAHELFEGIFGPVHEELIAKGIDTIVFAPRGVIGSIPPAILVSRLPADIRAPQRTRDYTDVAFLATEFNFASAPSAASFVAARQAGPAKSSGTVTVFGPPVPPKTTPAWTEDFTARMVAEGRPDRCGTLFLSEDALTRPLTPLAGDVASRFIRTDVTGEKFTDAGTLSGGDLSDQQVLVFVTHGFFGDGFCITEPSLLTSLAKDGGDGFLSASEILDLKLDAELVLLAACDTAREAEGAQGIAAVFDGAQLDGLVRSFIYAGARSVMATHWVADDAAADLVVRRFFASSSGLAVDNALRTAQMSLIAEQKFSHPYFWGPYVVIGDASRPLIRATGKLTSAE
ncbi:CHAT domain-containing protein [Parvibaculum sp.]|uniref:CHAT domain-containing protein n=1 Tax=Parvibaculum sp. TaxID=2024848 RepID=UPI001B12D48F|nr:CHAT domain-containing protein [Parvibaculum sp.]MBO6635728.1 CHAT domain-containing protein [Parvibaculum sp.]MBO6677784.1 CHAT domain-containing protein [Parvibaculum sp.]MBO6905717.1 CHAT domain-containing protein [Parvibaculum sp.]